MELLAGRFSTTRLIGRSGNQEVDQRYVVGQRFADAETARPLPLPAPAQASVQACSVRLPVRAGRRGGACAGPAAARQR